MEPLPLRGVPRVKVCKDCPPRVKPLPAPYQGPRCHRHHLARRKAAKAQRHEVDSQKLYGMPAGFFRRLIEFQGYRCAICPRKIAKPQRDHDHAIEDPTRSIRGLLCRKCNDYLGHIRDDREVVRRMLRYLDDPPAQRLMVAYGSDGEPQAVGGEPQGG